MVARFIKSEISTTSKSVLLLGPRQVGKSTLVSSLKPQLSINLADEMEFLRHSSNPGELRSLIELSKAKIVFLDEVQRLPKILNTVQALLDADKKMKFYLTGSSARKLKRGGANLLPGRVLNYRLGTLVSAELSYKMDTAKALGQGCLPEVYLGKSEKLNKQILQSYVANYLKEEIQAEALTRNLDSFARFLQESILSTGQFVDYSKLAKKAKVSRHSCSRYYEILEDTLVGQRLWPFKPLVESIDLIKHPKFYFFDNGVYNGLLGNFIASLDRVGILCEQLIYNQLIHSSWAHGKDIEVSTFRTRTGEEVDFILQLENQIFGIEVKHSQEINTDFLSGLLFFNQNFPKNNGLFVFHMGTREKKFGKIWSLPWQQGLKVLGL
jgi:predicted AAA+ superfamily ATPase